MKEQELNRIQEAEKKNITERAALIDGYDEWKAKVVKVKPAPTGDRCSRVVSAKHGKEAFEMNVLDLFSGIGGFSLGLERAGMHTVAFCEIDPYCRAVLKKHWPRVPCFEDVRELTAAKLDRLRALGNAVVPQIPEIIGRAIMGSC